MANELTMSNYLASDGIHNYLKKVLGERTPQFISSLTSLSGTNPALDNCTRQSLLGCALKATGLNLPFDQNLGFAWCIPYKDSRTNTTVAQFQIGTKGYVQLALRTGVVKSLSCKEVVEGELVENSSFMGEPVIRWMKDSDRVGKKIVGYSAGIRLTNGFEKVIFWSNEKLIEHAEKYSQSYRYADKGRKDSLWHTDFPAMAKKTLIKHLIKNYCPMSTELQTAIQYDQSSVTIDLDGNEDYRYVDNEENKISKETAREILAKIKDDKDALTRYHEFGYEECDVMSVKENEVDYILHGTTE